MTPICARLKTKTQKRLIRTELTTYWDDLRDTEIPLQAWQLEIIARRKMSISWTPSALEMMLQRLRVGQLKVL